MNRIIGFSLFTDDRTRHGHHFGISANSQGFIAASGLQLLAAAMALRMVLALIGHRGRMTCSAAAESVASESIHRGQLARFLARASASNRLCQLFQCPVIR